MRETREMTITFINGKYLTVENYDDMKDIENAIKAKEKFIYLFNTNYYLNLDTVCCIGCAKEE